MSAPLPRNNRAGAMDLEPILLSEPSADDADSLVSTNVPDDLENEQTWPTEEEMNGGQHDVNQDHSIPDAMPGTTPKTIKRIPKGMSEYQAAWIVDESDGEDEDGEDDADGEGMVDDEEMEEMVDMPIEEPPEIGHDRHVQFEDLDNEEEEAQWVIIHHNDAFTQLTLQQTGEMAQQKTGGGG